MRVHLPYGETTIEAELPENARLLANVEQARLTPLPDLPDAVRAALAAPCGLPRHLGLEVASSVEEAVARARTIHGPESAIAYVEQPPLFEP